MTEKPFIKAWPTKAFFIENLIKDISLIDAINELIDNSIDGLRKQDKKDDFSGFCVNINFTKDEFIIEDNCGGISLKIAEEYAFRFGYPKPAERNEPRFFGYFGVGMKRSIFKIGMKFVVDSTTKSSHFKVEVDINQWKQKDNKLEDWQFDFSERIENQSNEIIGTKIEITNLHKGISNEFKTPTFSDDLIKHIQSTHSNSIRKGMEIKINNIKVLEIKTEIKFSKDIQPAFLEKTIKRDTYPVKVKLIAGVGLSNPKEAGWYIFCNGRLILEADQTDKTVWDRMSGDISIPKIHHQFAKFRGYAIFDSDEPGNLPWNTTKNDLDYEAPVYMSIREEMVVLTRPVIDYLNKLDQEIDEEESDRILTAAYEQAETKTVEEIEEKVKSAPDSLKDRFSYNEKPSVKQITKKTSITYRKPTNMVAKVRKKTGATSNREVGEITFDYYYRYEIEE